MNPDHAFWAKTFATLGVEISVLAMSARWICSRASSARSRRAIWLGALVATVFVVPGEIFGVRDLLARETVTSEPRRLAMMDSIPTAGAEPVEIENTPGEPARDPRTSVGTPRSSAAPLAAADWWPGMLWLGGTVVLATRGLVVRALLAVTFRRLAKSASAECVAAASRLGRALNLGEVRLRTWPGLRSPIAFGLWRHTIALPVDFERRFDREQRDAIILHELAHLAAGDAWALLLAEIACVLAWWHPGTWWAKRRLAAEMEASADEATSLVSGAPVALAESLVRLGRELVTPAPTRGLGVAGASTPSQLTRRIRLLLSGTGAWRPFSALGRAVLLSVAGVLGAVLTLPAWPGAAPSSVAEHLAEAAIRSRVKPLAASSNPVEARRVPDVVPERVLSAKVSESAAEQAPGQVEDSSRPASPWAPTTRSARPLDAEAELVRDRDYRVERAGVGHGPPDLGPSVPFGSVSEFPPSRLAEISTNHVVVASAAISSTNVGPAVSLEVKFLEITDRGRPDFDFDWIFGDAPSNAVPASFDRPRGNEPGAGSPRADEIRLERLRTEWQSVVLSDVQVKALLGRLEAGGSLELLAAPRVTTVSGRSAHVWAKEAKTIVTGVVTNTADEWASPNVRYITEELDFGHDVRIDPEFSGVFWHLKVTSAAYDFIGYDDPGKRSIEVRSKDGTLRAQVPLPRLRARWVLGEGRISEGQSLLLRGPIAEQTRRIPRAFFRGPKTIVERRRLYVVVTPVPPA